MTTAFDVPDDGSVIRMTVFPSGQVLDLRRLQPSEIDIDDIAHSLANICRFVGHVPEHYSVAQHSVIVSRMVPRALALQALLHDASEAYLGDVSHYLKRAPELAGYRDLEDAIQGLIFERFGVPRDMDERVRLADHTATDLEWHQLKFGRQIPGFETIVPVPAPEARRMFLSTFRRLSLGLVLVGEPEVLDMRRLVRHRCDDCGHTWQQPAIANGCPKCHSSRLSVLDVSRTEAERI